MKFQEEITSNLNNYFENIEQSDIDNLTNLIIENKNTGIFFLGLGKSFNMCLQFSDLLSCININSAVLNPSNLLHGNMGLINKQNLIIVLSNSGNSPELVNILQLLKELKKCKIVLISSKKGVISGISDENIIIPIKNELSTCFNLIPTNSIMMYIVFMNNVLGSIIKNENIPKSKYVENHNSGSIGLLYKKIKDVMIERNKCCILSKNNTLLEAIQNMNIFQVGITIIEDDNKVEGVMTNRDLCTYLEDNKDIEIKLEKIMNKQYYYLEDDEIYLKDIKNDISYIPIIKNNKLAGLYID